jgi:PKD repeat protein
LGAITFDATAGGGSVLDLYSDFPYNPDFVKLSTGVLTGICHVVVDGHVVVVCPPIECKVTFLTNPGCPGFNITFCGTTYQNGSVGTFAYGTSGYAVANHGAGYALDHWEVSGNVQVSSKWINPTYVTITCGGTLKVVCRSLAPGYDCPVANFTFKKNGPRVNFNASASFDSVPTRAIASYRWDFGDGTTAAVSDFTIVHYYAKAGTYKVNLTVVNDLDESNSAEQNLTIRIPACAWKRL